MMTLWRVSARGLLLAGALLLSCSDDAKKSENGTRWRCQDSADINACSCHFATADTTLTMEVAECTPAIAGGAQCCVFQGGSDVVCACNSSYDVGCPAETQRVSTCSSAPSVSGDGGSQPEGPGGAPGDPCDCDDGQACTLDECDSGTCLHTPLHHLCPDGMFCSAASGCTLGEACAMDADCPRPDVCVTVECSSRTARCSYHHIDHDQDGEAPLVCGGADCNDDSLGVHSDAPEVCNGIDDDCDGIYDPKKDSGCHADESCIAAECVCDGVKSSCPIGGDPDARVCIDLQSDALNCGECGKGCDENEVCDDGKCACRDLLVKCPGSDVCVDLDLDSRHCGLCDVDCGNGSCLQGACGCGSDTENCGTTLAYDCRKTLEDENNCGGCDLACNAVSNCSAGECDAQIQYVKMYGSANGGQHFTWGSAPLAVDTGGNLFVGLYSPPGAQHLLPAGQTTAWTGPFAIAKLSPTADVLWTVPTTGRVLAVAAAGTDVWAFVASLGDMTIGNATFNLKGNHESVVALVKLGGAAGNVLDQDQLDIVTGGVDSAFLVADASGAWAALQTPSVVDHGNVSFTPTSDRYSGLLYKKGSDSPRWLPGVPSGLAFSKADELLVSVIAEGTDLTFGGGLLSSEARFGNVAAARYTKALEHVASFITPRDYYQGMPLVGDSTSAYVVGSDSGNQNLFEEFDYSGTHQGGGGGQLRPFSVGQAKLQGGKFYVSARANGTGGNFSQRAIPKESVLFMRYDQSTKVLENAIAFDPDAIAGLDYGGISSFVVTDNGTAAVLAVVFDDMLQFKEQTYDVTGNSGVAFVKLKLPAP